jgi:hypothetical protein
MAIWTENVKDLVPELDTFQEAMMDYVWLDGPVDEKSAEEAVNRVSDRPTWYQSPLSCGLTVGLNVFVQCLGVRKFPSHDAQRRCKSCH